ncbi:tape measure protein [Proteus alimentorum]|uniref:Tape measure protein n=1 Tax=Proteus alimentorum TaxID=1973495 RepID=A0ABS0ITG9_9GAMM|nr:tape measure protein [Proteus alimentorum]MBG2875476.1 tape measure protein [Proteus alimentorum]MBG2879329.1 tape measure protein [Proteus alimentorum]
MANVGEIVYQVQMDVQQLLTSQRQLEQRLNRMDSSFNRTSQSVNNTERSMQSLSKVAAALTGYLSASMVASYSEAWTELNNKLSNSVRASESLIDVTQRVFDISQATRSSLDATATLYARLERGTREYNTSAADLAKLTTIINQGFIVSGATAQEAENAIIQLSQGIASGVLRGEEFNSVAEQGSRLMVALADSLGVSIGQLRKMAAEGKLTTDVVVKGLLSQGDAIGKEFAKTTRTMSQAFQEAGNNLTKFLGENTTIKASINVFSDAVITASKSLDEMVLAVSLVASVVGGRYIAAMGLAIKAKMQSAVAARQEAIANLQAARVAEHNAIMTARKTALDLAAARALVEKAKTEFAAARGTNAEATALANLIAVRSAATTAAINHKQATQAQTAAMANSAAAARAASVSIGLANKALGFVGGPAGIAMAAGAAIMYFYQQAKEAREEAVKLAEGVNQLTAEMKNMTREQKRAESAKLKEALPELKNEVLNTTVAMKQAAEKVRELEADLALAKVGTSKYESITKQLADAQDKLAIATDNATKASNNYSRTKNTISFIQADLNGELKEGIDLLKREISVLPSGAKGWDSYGFSIDRALQKKKEFNGEKISFEWSKEGMDLRKSLEREMKLANAKSEVDKRLLQVDFYIEDKGITDEREIYQLKQIAIATQKAQDAAAERNKTTKESTKATDAAYEALKRQREEIELLNKGYKGGSLEMAKYDAVKALGDKASPEQIKLAEKLAEDKYNIERNLADKKAALELDLVAKAKESHDKQLADLERITKDDVSLTEQAARRKAEIEAEYQHKIAEIRANNAVSPQDNLKAQVDPVQQLKNEHDRKLALIKEYENQKVLTEQQSLELMNAANTQYEQDRMNAQWEIWRNQSQANQFLADGLDALGQRSANVITGLLTGTQSLNDAFRNVALTIVDQAVGALVQMGMQQVKNMITENAMRKASNAQAVADATATGGAIATAMAPAAATTSIATMGSAATWGMAAMAAAIPAMIALAGARKNGGQVGAGKMYRVGEGGKPEIFKASNGNQYMIPGDSGRVISNRQMGKGGNGVSMGDMHFTFQVQAPNGITQKEAQQIQQMVRGTVYDVLGTEMRSGGALEKSRSW